MTREEYALDKIGKDLEAQLMAAVLKHPTYKKHLAKTDPYANGRAPFSDGTLTQRYGRSPLTEGQEQKILTTMETELNRKDAT